MDPAIFLDRDGVIIENRDSYVRSWGDVYIYPQALEALSLFRNVPYQFVIVTNQSAVGRGIISLEEAESINDRLTEIINLVGGRINTVFMCPHSPSARCDCRKPQPGMFHQAADKLSINLSDSIMIGDALTDLAAAKAAGVKKKVLVKTGRGKEQSKLINSNAESPSLICETLLEAFSKLFAY